MTALIWLAFSIWAGWQLSRLLIGDSSDLLRRSAGSSAAAAFFCTEKATSAADAPFKFTPSLPLFLFRISSAIWLGILPMTWLTYMMAAFLAPLLPQTIHPLLIVNSLVLLSLAALIIFSLVRRLQRDRKSNEWPSLVRSLQKSENLFFLAVLAVWLVFGTWLMTSTFYQEGSFLRAGYSVFSDFAPHTALVSSFSKGQNWPTQYPHFANDGISYHFMFFFLCGNLNYLGLPLAWAINLPSILGLVTFCLLLGSLALLLTGKRLSFFLAPLMFFCRSSMAFLTWLKDLAAGSNVWLTLKAVWQAMLTQTSFIGNTVHDDWGLWGINVYANQRHFLPGLSLVLITCFLFLPDLQAGLKIKKRWRNWFKPDTWLVKDLSARRRLLAAILIVTLMPYWHGSALVGLMLILLPIAVFSINRLSFLLTALAAVISTLLQSWFFTGQAMRVIHPAFFFGFLADPRTVPGVFSYLLEMCGLALPLLIVAFFLPGWRRKILIAAFCLPLVFALTVSLTPDVTVNHKFIIMTLAFSNIYLADLLLRIGGTAKSRHLAHISRIMRVLAAVLLSVLLMITGFEEIIIVKNINKNTVAMDLNSPLAAWIEQNTSTDAIFVTAPYHYHAFFLSGRYAWLGHAYYAWSAGHDTAARWKQEVWLLSGGGGNLKAVEDLVRQESLDYLILDDNLRLRDDLTVDEAFFDDHFTLVAEFPDLGQMKIYALH